MIKAAAIAGLCLWVLGQPVAAVPRQDPTLAAICAAQRDPHLYPQTAPEAETLGDAYLCLEDFEGAIAAYSQALNLPGELNNPIGLRFKLAQVQIQGGQTLAAVETYHNAIALEPQYGLIVPSLSDRLYSPLGEPITDGGMRGNSYRGPISTPPDQIHAHAQYELATTLTALGFWLRGLEIYERNIEANPDFAYNYLAVAPLYEKEGRFSDAAEAYEKALALDPDLVWGYYDWAKLLLWQGEERQALEALQKVVGFHTGLDTLGEKEKEAIALDLAGQIYLGRRQWSEAAALYRQAVQNWPNQVPFHIGLGESLNGMGDSRGAIAAFQTALRHLPPEITRQHLPAQLGIAQAQMNAEQWDAARQTLNTILETFPHNREAHQLLQYLP
ncbi:tetratricopeptide repeat protein [Spirulina subsalsa]|uniref:tetratricopeptide repeat protein n=1 Tax=Spirulina subsalsa TaxID=54311 RepID=UPI0002E748A9|nr:tetratricopeptide repeat protein [Spirulina subsalsa]